MNTTSSRIAGASSRKEPLMTLPKVQTVAGSFLALVNSAVVLLIGLDLVHWTHPQQGLVLAAANAAVGLGVAVYAHFLPGTPREPVAIGGALTALVASVLALAIGFSWFDLTQSQVGVILAFVTTLIAFGSSLYARTLVAPISAPPAIDVPSTVVPPAPPAATSGTAASGATSAGIVPPLTPPLTPALTPDERTA